MGKVIADYFAEKFALGDGGFCIQYSGNIYPISVEGVDLDIDTWDFDRVADESSKKGHEYEVCAYIGDLEIDPECAEGLVDMSILEVLENKFGVCCYCGGEADYISSPLTREGVDNIDAAVRKLHDVLYSDETAKLKADVKDDLRKLKEKIDTDLGLQFG